MKEAIITNVHRSKFGEISIRFKFKKGDLTQEEIEEAYNRYEDGTPQEVEYQDFQPDPAYAQRKDFESVAHKKEQIIYQKFKRACIDYSGEDYYNRLKKHLGIEHLKDLEKNHSESMIKDLLGLQESYIFWKSRGYNHEIATESLCLDLFIHKDNAFNLWCQLFDDFNNPKS